MIFTLYELLTTFFKYNDFRSIMDMTLTGLPSIAYWNNAVETASVFIPVLAVLVSLSVYSLISGSF